MYVCSACDVYVFCVLCGKFGGFSLLFLFCVLANML